MSFMSKDWSLGPCAYLPMEKWESITNPFGISDLTNISYIFHTQAEKLQSLFGDVYIGVDELSLEDSEPSHTTNYYNVGLSEENLVADFLALYGELPLMRPYYPESTEGTQKSVLKLVNVFKSVLDLNEAKYRKLAQSLGFEYNPIENYNMTEGGEDTTTFSGKETNEHQVNANRIGGVEVSGPAENISITEDQETHVKNVSFDFDESKKIGYTEKAASDIEAGQKVGSGSNPGLTTGATPTTNNYTTTMDDASNGRLESYQTTTGTTGQLSDLKAETDSPVMAKITAGAPNHPSYTDEKSFTGRNDKLEHSLTRSGNIGVTTTQQMLEQERQIVRFSLINEFYQDLVEQLCLRIWD